MDALLKTVEEFMNEEETKTLYNHKSSYLPVNGSFNSSLIGILNHCFNPEHLETK